MNNADPVSLTEMSEKVSSGLLKPEFRDAIRAWQEKRRADVHQRVAARSAAVSRKKYREEREAERKTVRSYRHHGHLPQQPHESLEDFRKRLHRDRQQSYRAASDGPSRPRADLSAMTAEECTEHTRKLAAARKRRQRKKACGDVHGAVEAPSVASAIEWGMF